MQSLFLTHILVLTRWTIPNSPPVEKITQRTSNTYQQMRRTLLRYEMKHNEKSRSLYVEFMNKYREFEHIKLARTSSTSRPYYIIIAFIGTAPWQQYYSPTISVQCVSKKAHGKLFYFKVDPVLQPYLIRHFVALLHMYGYIFHCVLSRHP